MDDGDLILIAPTDNKNQDGSQTYFILDPRHSEDCGNVPSVIEIIDLTDDCQVENTGAIAVVTTSSTGSLEITLKKPKEEIMDYELSEINDVGGSCKNDDDMDMIIDDDTIRNYTMKVEEDVDVEGIHDVSGASEPKSEELTLDVSSASEREEAIHDVSSASELKSEEDFVDISRDDGEHQDSQIDQDDDTEGVLLIDDANCVELQEEVAPEYMQELNKFDKPVIKQRVDSKGQENLNNTPEVTITSTSDKTDNTSVGFDKNNDEEIMNAIEMSFGIVSGPAISTRPKEKVTQEAFIHDQVIEALTGKPENKLMDQAKEKLENKLLDQPTEKPENIDINEKDFSDSTNTALTLLELAQSSGMPLKENFNGTENQSSCNQLIQDDSHNSESAVVVNEPTLTTLQPVALDSPIPQPVALDPPIPQPVALDPPIPSILIAETPSTKTTDSGCAKPDPPSKSKTPSTPKPPVIRMTPDELIQRLKEGDTPRQLKEHGGRSRDALYMKPNLTKSDIAQEIMDRQLQKTPYTEPVTKDVIFAMKLAHRLATKIVPPETAVQQLEEGKLETKEDDKSTERSQNCLSSENKSNPNPENDKGSKKNYAISDKIELLKILEDDPDDPISPVTNQIILEQKVKIERKKSTNAPLIKMHPEIERELALKQLEDFHPGSGRGKGRKRVSFTPDKNIKVAKGLERNNNFNTSKKDTNGTKRKQGGILSKLPKKFKNDDVKSVTVDPEQITETLTVEGQTITDDPSAKDGKSLKQYSNKRLSRSSETPPRDLPMDIVLNGIDDPSTEISSTNKIFKATNPRKRKAELQEKRQKQLSNSNVFNAKLNKPQKRRGRPPKRKLYPTNDDLNKEFLLKANLEVNNGVDGNHESTISSDVDDKPVKTKKMREIERLLGDEGAINMLYSVEQKRASGGESKRGVLPSYRRKKKDLILKTKLVKSAVLRLTTNPPISVGRVSLRGQTSKEEEEGDSSAKNTTRKMSVDSHDSHHSLSSPPPEPFQFPAKIAPAEASRIIRRHSSSSNYSSRSNSPRRQSIDGERINITLEEKSCESGQVDSTSVNSKPKQIKTPQSVETKKVNDRAERASVDKLKSGANKDDLTPQTNNAEPKAHSTTLKNKPKTPNKNETSRRGRRKIYINNETKSRLELNTSLAAAVEDFAKENKSGGKNIPVDTPKRSTPSVPTKAVYRKSSDTTRTRTQKPSKVYKELTLKRHDKVVEIILAPVSTKLHNAFNVNVLQELTSVLTGLTKDDNCHVVLITSQGEVFCQGVDFPELMKPPEQRKVAAFEMVVAIKEFVKSVAVLTRPVVVAVHAPAVGLGVTLLPLCDMVLADPSATFHTPYTRLGHVPEGAATLTFPSLLGPAVTSELLFACRKFTSSEAQQAGLVTRVLPSENFAEEALTIAKSLSSNSAQAMKETKMLLRHGLLLGLETTLVSESHLLTKHWVTAECQANFASALEKGDYVLASPAPALASTSGGPPSKQEGAK